ncbi:MAG: Holliday junction branch migration protein RuvA [Lachnospiraceae bacterium]|nr:Holliday junction branch migration protein RuvA [Lachnospiraceae bacterium]
MIAYVRGRLEDVSEGNAVVDVGGIGYNVKISGSTMNELPHLHDEVKLHTYTYVREDQFSLYGFVDRDELEMFKLLITVNGIGPKGALGILSIMNATDLRFAILAADTKMIAKAPGIGKKTAERVIIDLRDKISMEDTMEIALDRSKDPMAPGNEHSISAARNEAVEALTSLGYSASDALKAVKKADDADENDVEAILKSALKYLI